MLGDIGVAGLLVALLIGSLLSLEVGFRLGRWRRAAADEGLRAHLMALQGAILGLLALLFGFTFAMAISRYEVRKALVLEEANALGTTVLRAQLLPNPEADSARRLLREYVDARLAFYAAGVDTHLLDLSNQRALGLQAELWQLGRAAALEDPRSVPIGLFLEALNGVIDDHEKRLTALDNHVPPTVLVLLALVSLTALGLMAFVCGLDLRRRFLPNALLALLLSVVFATILDLDRPRRGLIRVSQGSLERLANSFGAPVP
jgi:hypothetical protein